MILKNIEINVNKNLKIHILGELLEQRIINGRPVFLFEYFDNSYIFFLFKFC